MTSALAELAADKLVPIFQLYEWEWRNEGVPSKERIAETIDYLIASINEFDSDYSSSGRITVIRSDFGMEVKLDIASIDEYLEVRDI